MTTDIISDAAARIAADEERARAAGFALAPPLYAIGTPLVAAGVERLRRSRADFEALPYATDGLAQLAAAIRAEDRADTVTSLRDIRMLPGGNIGTPAGILSIEEQAFKRLAAAMTPGGGGYLAVCPPWLRASNLNHWAPSADGEATLRHRNGHDPRRVYAVVGPRYAAFDADRIADALARAAAPGARADILYDGRRSRVDILYHTDIRPEDGAAGEIFRAGVRVTSADDGTEAIRASGFVVRNRCRNLLILQTAEVETGRRVHKGGGIAAAVRESVAAAAASVSDFSAAWAAAERDRVIEAELGANGAEAAFAALVERRLISVAGERSEATVAGLMSAWQAEPAYNRTAILNAVTRYAHEGAFSNPWAGDALETQAGRLLHVRTLVLS